MSDGSVANDNGAVVFGDPRLPDRFWTKVRQTEGGCWIWTAGCDQKGYGQIWIARRSTRAHRLALEAKLGRPIGEGLEAAHRCDRPSCVRPDHLFEASHTENMWDMEQKGRQRHPRGEANGRAVLTEDEVRAIRAAVGTHQEIAARFGVGQTTIGDIRRRKIWRHIPDKLAA